MKELDQLGINHNEELNNFAVRLGKEYGIKQFSFELHDHEFLFLHDRCQQRMKYLKKLQNVLSQNSEHFKNSLRGIFLLFSVRISGYDDMGRFNLNVDDSNPEWLESLNVYSKEKSNEVYLYTKSRMEKEQNVSKIFSVKKIVPDDLVRNSYTYLSTLDRSLKYNPPDAVKHASPITLKFAPVDELKVYVSTQTIVLPYTSTPSTIYDILIESAGWMVKENKSLENDMKELQNQFNLAKLTYEVEPHLQLSQIDDCMAKMVRNKHQLAPYMNGLKIHLAHDYGINRETQTISVRHDFLL